MLLLNHTDSCLYAQYYRPANCSKSLIKNTIVNEYLFVIITLYRLYEGEHMDSDCTSNNTEYEIKSSVNGIVKILNNDFKMDLDSLDEEEVEKYGIIIEKLGLKGDDAAQVATYILIQSEQGSSSSDDSNNPVFENGEQYQALKLNKNHVVVFSELTKISIFDVLSFIARYGLFPMFSGNVDKNTFLKNLGKMSIEILSFLSKAIKKLDDQEECVFARIYELHKSGQKVFSAADIVCSSTRLTYDGDTIEHHTCDYQTANCAYRAKDNNECKINDELIKATFRSLADKGIIEVFGKGSEGNWKLVP